MQVVEMGMQQMKAYMVLKPLELKTSFIYHRAFIANSI